MEKLDILTLPGTSLVSKLTLAVELLRSEKNKAHCGFCERLGCLALQGELKWIN